ncbi:MAG: CPBP family intramembrane metalloprotease [Candidatus Eremiobacteraeota bacterium]|nr:CPBP family intramembrane metalloprotease [Candidatus Eremiobacteraeota bacterium]MBV8338415.1 CPBP family intramembrane metalloprotease [Candidatus Eremiobacteraeota bacterium]MBV8459651.1 CPBP family intramembrane metalloprotease [Candidatus Eremiobacteraeota bacterium]MBV8595308.1 CPBP family intramembrane metalloprotease [Candidatus Eremiobacteraeota bacterium]MBV8669785.1 CPBP family intramembrane metalloprotease [Candidatus Eremiobacteraeota bacterium]
MIASIFVKDARLRPPLRILVYGIVLICLTYVLATALGAVCASCLASTQPGALAAQMLVGVCTVALTTVWLRRRLDRRSVASLGFAPRGPWLRFFAIGVVFGAAMQTLAVAIEAVSGSAHIGAHASLRNDLQLLPLMIVVLLGAAFTEELSTRGYVLQNLWEAWGEKPAVVLSAVLFAAIHSYNPHLREQMWLTWAGLCAFGIFAACSLVWTGSLWLALGTHAAWNLFEGPIYGLPVSGLLLSPSPVITVSVSGPSWLTGANFGPEAGVSSLLALAIGALVLRTLYLGGAFRDQADTREAYARA